MKKTDDKQFLQARAKAAAAARWKNHTPGNTKVIRVSEKFLLLKQLLENNCYDLSFEDVLERLILLYRYFEHQYEEKCLSNSQGVKFLRILQNISCFESQDFISAYKMSRFLK